MQARWSSVLPTGYSCRRPLMCSRVYFDALGEPLHGEDGVVGGRADGPNLVQRPAPDEVEQPVLADKLDLSCHADVPVANRSVNPAYFQFTRDLRLVKVRCRRGVAWIQVSRRS